MRRIYTLSIVLAGMLATSHAQVTPSAPMPHAHKVKVASTMLTVTVEGKLRVKFTYSTAGLGLLKQSTLMVHNGHSDKDETYTGVMLSDLLEQILVTPADFAEGSKGTLHSYVRAEGTDHYYVVFSAAELLVPMNAMVALTLDGNPLTDDGGFKLIVAGDKKPARWVTNLTTLSVVTVE